MGGLIITLITSAAVTMIDRNEVCVPTLTLSCYKLSLSRQILEFRFVNEVDSSHLFNRFSLCSRPLLAQIQGRGRLDLIHDIFLSPVVLNCTRSIFAHSLLRFLFFSVACKYIVSFLMATGHLPLMPCSIFPAGKNSSA